MKSIYIFIALFIALVFVIVGYAVYDNYQKAQKLNSLNMNPNQVVIKPTQPVKPVVDVKITSTTYPNANLTPGFLLTMDKTFLCTPGTPEQLMKNTSEEVMKNIFESYDISYPPRKAYQIDRFIPVSLGGSVDDIRNLWPQSDTYPGFKEKNLAEEYLYKLMCNNTINISEAQKRIKSDWVVVYKESVK